MAKNSSPTNYGSDFSPFGSYSGSVIYSDGNYYKSKGYFDKGEKLKADTSSFSDFERNWYIENGFGDPTKLVASYYDRSGKLIEDPTRYEYRTPVIKGQGGNTAYMDLTKSNPLGFMGSYGTSTKYSFQGVSPEARQLYLQATGGVDPIEIQGTGGQTLGQKTTVATSDYGTGTIQSVLSEGTIPTIQDINIPMREQLSIMNRIRRAS